MADKKHFGNWLRRKMSVLRLTGQDLAEKSGAHVGVISRVLTGSRPATINFIQMIQPHIGCTINEALTEAGYLPRVPDGESTEPMIRITGTAKAGKINHNTGKKETDLNQRLHGSEAVIVEGNSMEAIAPDGSTIIYNPNIEVRHGDLVYVHLKNDGTFFKKFLDIANTNYRGFTKTYADTMKELNKMRTADNLPVALMPINLQEHDPIVCTRGEIEFMYKVVAVMFK